MMNSYVYTLVDPRNNLPFYVGKGSGERCNFHILEAKYYVKRKSLKLNKIRKLMSLGMKPIVIKVEEGVSDEQALDLECLLIAEMRDLGFKLTNMTDGGDGAKGYKHTEEHKKYVTQLFKGRIVSEETKQKMRKPKSEEGRKNMALARLTKTYRPSEETKRKTSEALKGRVFTDEHKEKIKAGLTGKPKTKIECPHCQKLAAPAMAKRWHFDNCKDKE